MKNYSILFVLILCFSCSKPKDVIHTVYPDSIPCDEYKLMSGKLDFETGMVSIYDESDIRVDRNWKTFIRFDMNEDRNVIYIKSEKFKLRSGMAKFHTHNFNPDSERFGDAYGVARLACIVDDCYNVEVTFSEDFIHSARNDAGGFFFAIPIL